MGKTYKQLGIEKRTMIQMQLSMGLKPGQIARELGRTALAITNTERNYDHSFVVVT